MQDFNELELKKEATLEEVFPQLLEKLHLDELTLKTYPINWIKSNIDEFLPSIRNIVKFGDYDNIIYSKDEIKEFLFNECSNAENWKINSVQFVENKLKLVHFTYNCSCIDEGNEVKGHVFVSIFDNAVKHSYVECDI